MQTLTLPQRLQQYSRLMRLDKPIGIFLLLWPTYWALWIAAEGSPDPLVWFVFTAGVFLMRSAGCVINDYADKDIDGHVERTKHRPLAQKAISGKEALMLFVILALTAFALVLTMNPLTIGLSVIGAFLAASYPFMKRFTNLPQVYLGAAFGWAVPMAYAAQSGQFDLICVLLFVITVLWTTAYDTMYAMVDRDDDLKIGVKSTAILFGKADKLIIGLLQFLTVLGLIAVGVLAEMAPAFYVGLALATTLALYQQFLIRHREKQKCFKAFLNNNWFGALVFLGILASYI